MTVNATSAASAGAISCCTANDWCSDAETRDNVIARRNVLAGLWAGRLMQMPGHALQSYVAAVHHADFCEPGDEDVVDKLVGDLNRCGLFFTPGDVRRKLGEFYRQAIMQTRETD
jgi:hypothetical protein